MSILEQVNEGIPPYRPGLIHHLIVFFLLVTVNTKLSFSSGIGKSPSTMEEGIEFQSSDDKGSMGTSASTKSLFFAHNSCREDVSTSRAVYSRRQDYDKDILVDESPQKLARKGPTPDMTSGPSSNTRSKIRKAFETSGLLNSPSSKIDFPMLSREEKSSSPLRNSQQIVPEDHEILHVAALVTCFANAWIALSSYRYFNRRY